MTEDVLVDQEMDNAAADGGSVDDRDRAWLAHVYRGDKERDLTIRAVLAGMAFGGLMSLSNLYVGLKSGWGLGIDIAAVIVIFAVFKAFRSIGLVRREFGIMENTMMMSTAVAASWISSAGLVSAVPALTMLTGKEFTWWQLMLFVGVILYLGLFMAIPLKRQMIQVDSLRFPSNIATGETLIVMYSQGTQALKKAAALGIASVVGIIVAALRDGFHLLPDDVWFPGRLNHVSMRKLTLGLQPSLIFVSIGALFGMKVGLSMLLGAVINYGVLAPQLINAKIIKHPPPKVAATAAPHLPLTVKAGQKLTLELQAAVSQPELPTAEELRDHPDMAAKMQSDSVSYTWNRSTTYKDLPHLVDDLDAPTLQDGSPNPFQKTVAAGIAVNKENGDEMLILSAPVDRFWEARLLLPADETELLSSLGFKDLKDIGTAKARLATAEHKLAESPTRVADAEAALSEADAGAKNAEERVARGEDGGARQALVRVEIARNRLEYARAKAAAAKKEKTDAENAVTAAEKAFDKSTATVGEFPNISRWSLWPGATVLVVGGLLALAFQWRTLARTFAGIFAGLVGRRAGRGPLDHIEIPMTWFVVGFPLAGLAAAALLTVVFHIHWWMGAVAVVLTFFLAAVVARVGAEIGINPIGAMGKVTQLAFGALAPGNITANLMTAGVTAGAACSCGDTVGNLKVGHMVGANPRRQFISQFFGVFAGAILAVPAYFILVPDANALGGEKFPAPSALVWKGVAEALAKGLSSLPVSALWAIAAAFVLGTIIVVIDNVFPKLKPYTPSPAALGIAFTVPASQGLAMFLGAFIVWILEKKTPKWNAMYTVPVASGCIAGESITGVVIAALMAAGLMH